MKLLQITETQFVPADKLDFIGIDCSDKCSIVFRTTGGYTIINHYNKEELCREELKRVINQLNEL